MGRNKRRESKKKKKKKKKQAYKEAQTFDCNRCE
jgi:hypothetical protein